MANDQARKQDDQPQKKLSDYKFKGSSEGEDYHAIARIHYREAKQLLESAQVAKAEERQEEYKLLTDLAIARRETADEFELAANGLAGDPIVAEILDWQEDLCEGYVPHTPIFIAADDNECPTYLAEELKRPDRGPIARAVAWVGNWIS
ncbi:MAG: hypothetical protein ABR907_04675 [Terracidiphilus sp.]